MREHSEAYQGFKQALGFLVEKQAAKQAAAPAPCPPAGGPRPVSVAALQAQVLTPAQLEAVAELQGTLTALLQLEQTANQLVALHRLPATRVCAADAARLLGDLDNLLFDHKLSVSKLARGVRDVPAMPEQVAA